MRRGAGVSVGFSPIGLEVQGVCTQLQRVASAPRGADEMHGDGTWKRLITTVTSYNCTILSVIYGCKGRGPGLGGAEERAASQMGTPGLHSKMIVDALLVILA